MSNNIANYKKRIINGAVIIIAGVVAFNLYSNQLKEAGILKQAKELEIKKNAVLTDIIQLEQKINAYKSIANNKDVSNIINTLGGIARDTNVKLISLKPGQEQDFPLYTKYFFQMNVSVDNYGIIGRFLSNLESSPDIYIVDSIDINKKESSRQEADVPAEKLSVELTVSTILFK